MEFLHNDRERFSEVINLASYQTGIMASAVEKDYIDLTTNIPLTQTQKKLWKQEILQVTADLGLSVLT